MHGYFISLKLYDTARVIANPFAYDEHRAKMVREKMEKMSESRIRTKKEAGVKVNKALAEKILRDEEKAQRRAEKKNKRKQGAAMDVDAESADKDENRDDGDATAPSILSDPRFVKVFENPEFAIDENSREFALLNPSSVGQVNRGKTVVEEEDEESDKSSSDGLSGSEDESQDDDDKSDSSDSSDEGGSYSLYTPKTRN